MKRQPWLSRLFESSRTGAAKYRAARKVRRSSQSRTGCAVDVLETRVLPAVFLQFDYSLDANNFFDPSIPARRIALEAAGDAISSRLEDVLEEIIPHKDNPADTWSAIYTNPATGVQESTDDLIIGESIVIVYAGGRQLGSTLGIGGPGGFSASGTQAWLDLIRGRGQSGALLTSGNETDFSLWGGTIAFDIDTNWHFDLGTSGLDSGESDFYSVALHELTHMLGFGTAASWDNQVSAGAFTGTASVAEYDFSGNPPVHGDLSHWQDGLTDGGQETSMDPTLLVGSRKLMTELDFAALKDVGWEVTPGSGGGGGGPVTIQLANGVTHSLIIQDDGIANNGRSEYILDGAAAVQFDSAALNVTVNGGNMSDVIAIASIDGNFTGNLTINAAAGNDSLIINHNAGNNVTFNGGSDSDDISFIGSTATAITYLFDSVTAGSVLFDDASASLIAYSGLESVSDNVSAVNRIFSYAASGDIVTLRDDSNANDGISQVVSAASAVPVNFVDSTNSLTLNTGAGNDVITVGSLDAMFSGSVTINTEDGDDAVDASTSSVGVSVIGANGNDLLIGSAFADALLGEMGDDQLFGGGDNDILLGSGGNDVLIGGLGNDIMNGGEGIDRVSESANVNFILTTGTLAGAGTDTLIEVEQASLTGGAGNNEIDASDFGGPTTIVGGGGDDTITGSDFADHITTGDGADVINGNGGDDIVFAMSGNDTVNAGSGNDFVDGGFGDDSLLGGDGIDVLVGSVGDDIINGQAGNDIQFGGSGKDILIGEAGDDQLNGQGTSGDRLTGGLGNDMMDGGGGGDSVFESGDVNFTISAFSLQGAGDDTLISIEKFFLIGGPSANVIDASGAVGDVTVLAGDGNDTVIVGGFGFNVLLGEGGNDTLIGGDGIDYLLGASGADELRGNGGNDILKGQGGSNDRLFGGPGNDLIDGGVGGDKLFGEAGDDTMLGLAGNDVMDGGSGNDSMLGGDGDDLMNGGDDNDTLNGGAGNDSLDGDDGNDGLSGFTGNDFLLGDYGDDTIYGGADDDVLIGAAGSDTLIGQGGADFVKGNSGVDLLAGGSGAGADPDDIVIGDPGEIDEFFTFAEPSWVNNV